MQPEAFFLPADSADDGQRFCLFYPAQRDAADGSIRGQILYVHPFAEEMNKSRRMAALQARALARAGFDVLQIDLLGCGDSSGDFGDSSWQSWISDVLQGCQWLRNRNNAHTTIADREPLWLWGLRAGCLLAVAAAGHLTEPCNFLFWQPPSSGKLLLQQFLRLKVAGDMLGGEAKGVMVDMRRQLANGVAVEIAGYRVSPGLAQGLEHATLTPPGGRRPAQRLEWFELTTQEDTSLSPISAQTIAQWQRAGFAVRGHITKSPAFWQTTEIEEAPALLVASTAALSNMSA